MVIAALALSLSLAQSTSAKLPSPATLQGETYYLASELDQIAHHFDPEQWLDGEPMTVAFEAPGKVNLNYAQDGDECAFTATGKRATYQLALDCKGQSITKARWVWLGPGHAKTSLLSGGETPEGLKEVVLQKAPVDIKALQAAFDANYAAAQLPRLVGSYRDATGLELNVAADGSVTLAGEKIAVALKRCSPEMPPLKTGPCLVRLPPQGEPQVGGAIFLELEEKGQKVLEEGVYGSDIAYYAFERVPKARRFVRVDGSTAPPAGK